MEGLWSTSADNAHYALQARGATAYYPSAALAAFRYPKGQSAHQALVAAAGGLTPDELDRQLYSDRILFMGSASANAGDTLHEFSLQAFVCIRRTISEALTAGIGALPPNEVRYYRHEHHPGAPGPIFAEPPVHMHVVGNGSPRFAGRWCSDPVLHFLEMLALEHEYESWRTWAWFNSGLRGLEEDFLEIEGLYKTGQLRMHLAAARPKIEQIKSALEQVKAPLRRDRAETMHDWLFYPIG